MKFTCLNVTVGLVFLITVYAQTDPFACRNSGCDEVKHMTHGVGHDLSAAAAPTLSLINISQSGADAAGITHYTIESPYQSNTTTLRLIYAPTSANTRDQRILFVLPVEPNEENRFGDGLTEIVRQNLHVKHNLIVVAPTFDYWPWYADHPTDGGRRQESYLIKVIIPLIDQLFPCKHQHRLLLGFSKSGWGALSLILRHPGMFEAASTWDSPLMKAKPDGWELPQ